MNAVLTLHWLSADAAMPSSRAATGARLGSHTGLEPELSADLSGYVLRLEALGLAPREVRQLTLARLEQAFLPNATPDIDRYWRRGQDRALAAYELAEAEALELIGTRLVELFGDAVRSDPLLRRIFEPLSPRFAFLATGDQFGLWKHRLERRLAASAQSDLPDGLRSSTAQPGDYDALLDELSAVIGSVPAIEYLYRASPIAAELRAAGLTLSEPEFRSLFDLVLSLEKSRQDPETFRIVRSGVRKLIGSRNFHEFWSRRDPLYSVLAQVGIEQGLSEARMRTAYALINDSQDNFAEAAHRLAADPAASAIELRRVRAELESRLAGLVGADVADALLLAQARMTIDARSFGRAANNQSSTR